MGGGLFRAARLRAPGRPGAEFLRSSVQAAQPAPPSHPGSGCPWTRWVPWPGRERASFGPGRGPGRRAAGLKQESPTSPMLRGLGRGTTSGGRAGAAAGVRRRCIALAAVAGAELVRDLTGFEEALRTSLCVTTGEDVSTAPSRHSARPPAACWRAAAAAAGVPAIVAGPGSAEQRRLWWAGAAGVFDAALVRGDFDRAGEVAACSWTWSGSGRSAHAQAKSKLTRGQLLEASQSRFAVEASLRPGWSRRRGAPLTPGRPVRERSPRADPGGRRGGRAEGSAIGVRAGRSARWPPPSRPRTASKPPRPGPEAFQVAASSG